MQIEQRVWTAGLQWQPEAVAMPQADLVFVFGGRHVLAGSDPLRQVRAAYPHARLAGCSTAGEIAGTHVYDDSLVTTAVHFDSSRVEQAEVEVAPGSGSRDAGTRLAHALDPVGLRHVLVVSDGAIVNGSDLVAGMVEALPAGVEVTGGLAADGARFEQTLTVSGGVAATHRVVALGLYGDRLHVGFGSLGGWDPFGPLRIVTRSKGNVLFELDGQPALALYKRYLGEHAAGLPATGLLFPLNVQAQGGATSLTRTILAVNEADQSLTFAGDIPQGAVARLMKANFDRLVDGAQGAAEASREVLGSSHPELALLISCVGRKLVLKQRVEEELEAVQEVLGPGVAMAGFYSYGEICPSAPNAGCELHNQTMTITTLREA